MSIADPTPTRQSHVRLLAGRSEFAQTIARRQAGDAPGVATADCATFLLSWSRRTRRRPGCRFARRIRISPRRRPVQADDVERCRCALTICCCRQACRRRPSRTRAPMRRRHAPRSEATRSLQQPLLSATPLPGSRPPPRCRSQSGRSVGTRRRRREGNEVAPARRANEAARAAARERGGPGRGERTRRPRPRRASGACPGGARARWPRRTGGQVSKRPLISLGVWHLTAGRGPADNRERFGNAQRTRVGRCSHSRPSVDTDRRCAGVP